MHPIRIVSHRIRVRHAWAWAAPSGSHRLEPGGALYSEPGEELLWTQLLIIAPNAGEA